MNLHLMSVAVSLNNPRAFLLVVLAVLLILVARSSLRGLTANRLRFVLAVRLAIFTLLVLALAGPVASRAAEGHAVAFLVDRSDSISLEQQAEQMNWIGRAMAGKGRGNQSELIVFGKDSTVDQPLSTATKLPDLATTVAGDHTDIGSAIRLAMGNLPNSASRGIILLSDGAENSGSALQEARIAAAAGIPVSYVRLSARNGPEVLVARTETPATLREQDSFAIKAVVEADTAQFARIRVLLNGRLDSSHTAQLTAGSNLLSFPHKPLANGFHTIELVVEGSMDTIAENNAAVSYTTVLGKAKVLILEGAQDGSRFLADALRAAGMDLEVRAPINLPPDLRAYDSIVLLNVAASQLAAGQQQSIKTYVQSLAGGLAVIGGDHSYGVGGYARTPLEEVLPVSTDLKGRQLQSSVALVVVIDTSGSMAEGPTGATKMDMAKQAATQAIGLLGDQDQVGVLAFEDDFRWVVPAGPLSDRDRTTREIGTLAPGGGTDIFPALQEAYRTVSQTEAKVRHIILMTDGIAPAGDYNRLTEDMRVAGITLSTISIGTDADFGLLQKLAAQGKGRYYEGIDPFDVPQLAVKETLEVARAAIVEEPVQVVPVNESPILDGVEVATMPPLAGYVATTAKPSSTTILASNNQDPLLVEWQYGLGEVVSWTSDAENRWAADILNWPQIARFWAQMVKRTIPGQVERNVHMTVRQEGSQGHIVVDTLSDAGTYLNSLATTATIADPIGRQVTINLRQTAPGRYEGSFETVGLGAYAIQVVQRNAADGAVVAEQNGGFVIPYSPEYRALSGNTDLLANVAETSGGVMIAAPAEAYAHTGSAAAGGKPLWPYFVAAALVLFLFDVGLRRLRLEVDDVRRGFAMTLDHWREAAQPVVEPAAQRLIAAKRRSQSLVHDGSARVGHQATAVTVQPKQQQAIIPTKEPVGALGARLLEAKNRVKRDA